MNLFRPAGFIHRAASSEFGTYRLCEQRGFRQACAVSPEPPLLAHTSSESRGTFRPKARSLAPLNGWVCAVKIFHDRMLEDTNSRRGPHWWVAMVCLKLHMSHVTDKWWSWFNNVFFFRRIFYKFYSKTSQITNKSDWKIECKCELIFIFPTFIEVSMQWVPCKVNLMPTGYHLVCTRPIAFILR